MTPQHEARLYRTVGSRARRERERRGLTQTALASDLGVSRASVVNIEKGRQRAPLHLLWSMAELLGVEVTDLIPTRVQLADRGGRSELPPTVLDRISAHAGEDPAVADRLAAFVQSARSPARAASSAEPAPPPTGDAP